MEFGSQLKGIDIWGQVPVILVEAANTRHLWGWSLQVTPADGV